MEIEKRLKSFENFKKRFKNESKKIEFDELERVFFVQNYFYITEIEYIEDRFYSVIFEICSNILKGCIQELEYYVNSKPNTLSSKIDQEVLSKEENKLQKIYLRFHIFYKKVHKMAITNKSNTKESMDFLSEIFEDVDKFKEYSSCLQDKFIEKYNTKIKEIGNNKSNNYESSIFQ
jgi:uncharacterized membrane protein YgaE (UPF0421/DUF939 family)